MHRSASATKPGTSMHGIHQARATVTVAINCYNLNGSCNFFKLQGWVCPSWWWCRSDSSSDEFPISHSLPHLNFFSPSTFLCGLTRCVSASIISKDRVTQSPRIEKWALHSSSSFSFQNSTFSYPGKIPHIIPISRVGRGTRGQSRPAFCLSSIRHYNRKLLEISPCRRIG